MAKSAKKKKKTETQVAAQRMHNRATKGNNTRNRPCVWETRRIKDDDGKYRTDVVEYDSKTKWDWSKIYDAATDQNGVTRLVRKRRDKQPPLYEPFDTLLEDWEEGIRNYAMEWDAQIDRIQLDNGWFRYIVYQKVERTVFTLLTVESPKNIHFGGRKKFRKRRK